MGCGDCLIWENRHHALNCVRDGFIEARGRYGIWFEGEFRWIEREISGLYACVGTECPVRCKLFNRDILSTKRYLTATFYGKR